MDNIYFYAFHPERYDPRKDPTYNPNLITSIADVLASLPLSPPQENQAFTPLIEQLHQWAKDEPREGFYDAEAVEYYKNFPNNYLTQDRAYFELAYTPQVRTEAWYLEMIEIANYAGLIVYSDIDEGLYFPDGTSQPEWYRADLETIVENQEPMVSQDYEEVLGIIEAEKSNPTPIGKSNPYLANDEDKANIFQAIIKHKLAEYGYEPIETQIFQDGTVKNKIIWQDAEIWIRFQGRYYENQLQVDFSFAIEPQDKILEDAFEPFMLAIENDTTNIPLDVLLRDRNSLKRALLKFSYSSGKMLLCSIAEHEKLMYSNTDQQNIISNFWKKFQKDNKLNTIGELKKRLEKFLDETFNWLGDSKSFYDYFDKIYHNTNHPLHSYYWASTYYIPDVFDNTLIIARYLQHPDLAIMIEKQLARIEIGKPYVYDVFYERLEKIMVGYDPNFYQK